MSTCLNSCMIHHTKCLYLFFFFSSRRRHTRLQGDWSSDVCSSDLFTPTGDVIQLPKGATPIDFAFAVHTEVGLHCQGARINGRIASLARELKNSETVEIITSPSAKPSRDWLSHVRTGRARHKIRQRLRIEEHTTSIKLGRENL